MLIAGYSALLETDPHVQEEEGLSMLKMLNWFVENLPFDNGRAGGMPLQQMVMLSLKRGAPMPVPGCQLEAHEALQ